MSIINEKDIFIYIFYPDQLNEEKLKFICENIDRLSSEIEFLKEIKKNLNLNVAPSIIDKISERINSDLPILIELTKEEITFDKSQFVLAADSPKSQLIQSTDTFKDADNRFLAKVINTKTDNKIYIFKNSDDESIEMKITILPSDETYHANLNDQPIIITPPQTIEKITLQINS